MSDPSEKWNLHHRIIAVVGTFAALLFFILVLDSQGRRGLDGLGSGLAAVGIAVGTVVYLAVTTIVVDFVKRRRDVWIVHLVSPFVLAAMCIGH